MATVSQNKDFSEAVFAQPAYPLDDAVEWIAAHMDPEDVFTDVDLGDWAESRGYVKEE